jgi:hypothetical protein
VTYLLHSILESAHLLLGLPSLAKEILLRPRCEENVVAGGVLCTDVHVKRRVLQRNRGASVTTANPPNRRGLNLSRMGEVLVLGASRDVRAGNGHIIGVSEPESSLERSDSSEGGSWSSSGGSSASEERMV